MSDDSIEPEVQDFVRTLLSGADKMVAVARVATIWYAALVATLTAAYVLGQHGVSSPLPHQIMHEVFFVLGAFLAVYPLAVSFNWLLRYICQPLGVVK